METAATSIMVITAATAVRAAVAAGSLTPDGRAGLPGTASRLDPASLSRPPLDRLSPLARWTTRRRWPAGGRLWPAGLTGSACRRSAAGGQRGSKRRSSLMPQCGRSQTIARAGAAIQPVQPSTFHDDAFHE